MAAGADALRIRSPDDKKFELQKKDRSAVIFKDTQVPGWYATTQWAGSRSLAPQPMDGFFVRLPAKESDLTELAESDVSKWLGSHAKLESTAFLNTAGQPMADWLLFFVLMMLLLESYITRR
jgi:hypothetical protein